MLKHVIASSFFRFLFVTPPSSHLLGSDRQAFRSWSMWCTCPCYLEDTSPLIWRWESWSRYPTLEIFRLTFFQWCFNSISTSECLDKCVSRVWGPTKTYWFPTKNQPENFRGWKVHRRSTNQNSDGMWQLWVVDNAWWFRKFSLLALIPVEIQGEILGKGGWLICEVKACWHNACSSMFKFVPWRVHRSVVHYFILIVSMFQIISFVSKVSFFTDAGGRFASVAKGWFRSGTTRVTKAALHRSNNNLTPKKWWFGRWSFALGVASWQVQFHGVQRFMRFWL